MCVYILACDVRTAVSTVKKGFTNPIIGTSQCTIPNSQVCVRVFVHLCVCICLSVSLCVRVYVCVCMGLFVSV